MAGEQKMKNVATEADEWLRVDKVCPCCQSNRCKLKYLNNRKRDQPCYSCLDCKTIYGLHAQKGARRPHPEGYRNCKSRDYFNMLKASSNFECGHYGFEHLLPLLSIMTNQHHLNV